MAFAHVANRGAVSAKAAGAALDLVLGAGQDIGLDRLVLVWAAWDNSDNVDAATTRLSASDEVANTYTPVVEFTQGGGAAAAGVTAFLAAAVTSTAPEEGDFIRVTSTDATRVAKVLSVVEFSKAAGSTIVVADIDADGGTGGGAFAPTLADLEEREYLLAGGFVFERGDHASLAFDQDDDYTDIGFGSTVGGAANANLSLFGGFRIATVTGDTWGVSVGAAAGECAHFLVAFYEEVGGDAHSGASAVSGGGAAATSGRKGATAAGSTSGAGGSGSGGGKGASEGSDVSGGGATASSGAKAASSASSASTAGSGASSGQKNASASSAVSGGGHVTSTGTTLEAHSGSSAVSGGGAATSSGAKGGRGGSSVPGGGAVITVAVKGAFSTSTVSAGGVVTTAATSARFAASLVSGGGDVVTQTFAGAPAAPPATTRTHAGSGPTGRTLAGFATGRTHAGAGSGRTGSELED